MRTRGAVPDTEQDTFRDTGYSERTMLEDVLAIALKTMSNYTSHLIGIELGPFMAENVWRRAAAAV